MPTVTIPLNGRTYDIACGPGEEDRVQEVAARLRGRMEEISRSLGGKDQAGVGRPAQPTLPVLPGQSTIMAATVAERR